MRFLGKHSFPWEKILNTKKVEYKKDAPAVIVYTRGTTGIPKGAMLSNDTLNIIEFSYMNLGQKYDRTQRMLDIMPPFIAYGVTCGIHMPLTLGITDVLIPLLDVEKLPDLFIKYKPAHYLGVPMHFEKLARSSKMASQDMSYLISAGAGGDAISDKAEIEINKFLEAHNSPYPIAKGYGMTEVGSAAVACHGNVNKVGSVGIPHIKTTVSIFEPNTDKELTYGEEGEICFTTPAMMLGYIANEKENDSVFMKHSDGNTWIHSGDIGYMDSDGFIFLKGRIKRMIIRPDGHNVFPVAIENVIISHQSVEACAVVGKADIDSNGKWPVAFIVVKPNVTNSTDIIQQIEELCSEKIPPRDTAVAFYTVNELPMTNIGRIDYRLLEEMADKQEIKN